MRKWLLLIVLAVLWPAAALAAQSVQQLVEAAIKAINTVSYEGRMRFLSKIESGGEQTVNIYHVAPDLYRVEPLVNGVPGDTYFIENAKELLRCSKNQGSLALLPVRQFSVNDNMTRKFLRDLGTHSGTTVLEGRVGDYGVYVLRQIKGKDKPYTITVGLDKGNYYPIFLLVTDGEDKTRVYYEMEQIRYRKPSEIDDARFTPPQGKVQRLPQAPRAASSVPAQNVGPEQAANAKSSAAGSLPLYPDFLPDGYSIESITQLMYSPPSGGSALVYQIEIYGPKLTDLVSIFETEKLGFDFGLECNEPDCGFFVDQIGNWQVAILGNGLKLAVLKKMAAGLQSNDAAMRSLLAATAARDDLVRQVTNASD